MARKTGYDPSTQGELKDNMIPNSFEGRVSIPLMWRRREWRDGSGSSSSHLFYPRHCIRVHFGHRENQGVPQ